MVEVPHLQYLVGFWDSDWVAGVSSSDSPLDPSGSSWRRVTPPPTPVRAHDDHSSAHHALVDSHVLYVRWGVFTTHSRLRSYWLHGIILQLIFVEGLIFRPTRAIISSGRCNPEFIGGAQPFLLRRWGRGWLAYLQVVTTWHPIILKFLQIAFYGWKLSRFAVWFYSGILYIK